MRFENDSSRSFNSRALANHFGGFSRSPMCRRRSRTLGDRVEMHRDRKNLDTNARYFRSLRDRESVIWSHISVGKMTPRPYQMVIRLVH